MEHTTTTQMVYDFNKVLNNINGIKTKQHFNTCIELCNFFYKKHFKNIKLKYKKSKSKIEIEELLNLYYCRSVLSSKLDKKTQVIEFSIN